MSANDAARLKQQLAQRTGLSLGLLERSALAGFVQRRCQELGLADESAYHQLVMRDPGETERLVKEVSVPETWFFRYPASFELLIDHGRSLWRESHDKLRMLSIACATGEEPYGMAMAAMQATWPLDRVAVTAVDRHEASLAIARAACYGDNSFREPVPNWAEPWFEQTNDCARVDAKIVSRVSFHCQDILSGTWPASQATYDIVFCRNLFIYLSDSARARLSDLLLSLLSHNGILFVGHAELPILPSGSFESAGVRQTFALRRKDSSPVPRCATTAAGKRNLKPTQRENRARQTTPPRKQVIPLHADPHAQQNPTLDGARALADAGQLEQALAVLQTLQSLSSSSPDFFALLGSIKLGLGQLQEARDAFNKVLYFEPGHEASLLQMAIISDRFGNSEQASRFRRRANRAHEEEQRQSSEENL